MKKTLISLALVVIINLMLLARIDAQPANYCPGPGNSADNGTYAVLNPGNSTTIYTSAHFAARWNASDGVILTQAQALAGLNTLEAIWNKYIYDIGFVKPYANDAVKYKIDIYVSNQGWASGGGTDVRHPAMWLHYNAFQDPGALAHEFAHSLQYYSMGMRDSEYVGWSWESHAEWMRHQYFRDQVNCAEMLVNYPHLYYGSTRNRYCNWQFWEFVKDKFCYRAINDIWANAKKPGETDYTLEDPFSVLIRNMGWSQSQLNNVFGDWAMHNATWDYPNGAVYRNLFGSYSERSGNRRSRVTMLQPVDINERRFAVPDYWAPQRWGYNLVKLVPDYSNGVITVSFKGIVQTVPASTNFGNYARQPTSVPAPGSDWRWGVIAKNSSGITRYSPMQTGAAATLNFQVNTDDTEIWLVVAATPTNMHKILWDQMYYTIYRYPWMIKLDGAWPEGYPNITYPSGGGALHPNGGGWVASTASVASTVWVGPRARVLDTAQVSGNARIEDSAIVGGNAQVYGNAIIEDYAQVMAGKVYENARVSALSFVNHTGATIHGNARLAGVMNSIWGAYDVSGTAKILGDMELHTSLTAGTFYGIVDAAISTDTAYGSTRTVPSPEVSIVGPFAWSGSRLVPNGRRSFEASDLTGSFFYVSGTSGNVSAITSSSSTSVKQAATFEIVPGLDTSRLGCVSFRSITNTTQYLRHAGFRMYMNTNNNSALFKADATFCPAPGLTGSGASFESLNFPGRFLRRRNLELWVDPEATDAGYKSNATFNVVGPWIP